MMWLRDVPGFQLLPNGVPADEEVAGVPLAKPAHVLDKSGGDAGQVEVVQGAGFRAKHAAAPLKIADNNLRGGVHHPPPSIRPTGPCLLAP